MTMSNKHHNRLRSEALGCGLHASRNEQGRWHFVCRQTGFLHSDYDGLNDKAAREFLDRWEQTCREWK